MVFGVPIFVSEKLGKGENNICTYQFYDCTLCIFLPVSNDTFVYLPNTKPQISIFPIAKFAHLLHVLVKPHTCSFWPFLASQSLEPNKAIISYTMQLQIYMSFVNFYQSHKFSSFLVINFVYLKFDWRLYSLYLTFSVAGIISLLLKNR